MAFSLRMVFFYYTISFPAGQAPAGNFHGAFREDFFNGAFSPLKTVSIAQRKKLCYTIGRKQACLPFHTDRRTNNMELKIGETIRHLRREKDVTQEEFAAVIGVSAQAVSKWERPVSPSKGN